VFSHIFYDFYNSPLDVMMEDVKPTFDPTQGHIRPGPPKPSGPPPFWAPDLLRQSPYTNEDDEEILDT